MHLKYQIPYVVIRYKSRTKLSLRVKKEKIYYARQNN